MCVLRRVLQTASSPQRKGGEIPKRPRTARTFFCHVGRLTKSSKVIFFKMTSRTAPLLSDKKLTPKGQLAYPPKKKNHPKTSNNTKSTPPIAVAIQKNFSSQCPFIIITGFLANSIVRIAILRNRTFKSALFFFPVSRFRLAF